MLLLMWVPPPHISLLTPCLQEDPEGLRIHLPPVRSLQRGLIPGHQGRVGPVVQQQVDERHLTPVTQHGVQQAGGQAAGQGLVAHGPVVVEVGLRAGLEQQLEAVEVVVGSADVEGTHHQGVEGAGAQEEPGAQLVVHVYVCIEPGQTENQGYSFTSCF